MIAGESCTAARFPHPRREADLLPERINYPQDCAKCGTFLKREALNLCY
jgi:hypothetical protein